MPLNRIARASILSVSAASAPLAASVPAAAHGGAHGALSPLGLIEHVASSPSHALAVLAFLLFSAAGVWVVARKRAEARDRNGRRR